jgi:excisionase family DNA binding protein
MSEVDRCLRVPLVDSTEVAAYLNVPARTLDQWAWKGTGPKFAKVGKFRRYKWADVDAWLDDQTFQQDDGAGPSLIGEEGEPT